MLQPAEVSWRNYHFVCWYNTHLLLLQHTFVGLYNTQLWINTTHIVSW